MFTTIALLLALQAPAPGADDVRTAIEDQLNAACSGLAEADGCGANRTSVEVRALTCSPAGEDVAACRYERRTRSAARGQGPWQPAQTNFRFDVETGLWFVDDGERG
ncbi:MAG TPA: hypothetical protein VEW25_08035 [Allosphingosinicella sp.]|nr:hypothetical protein [Allosphingosinicella sp.]